MYVIFYSFLYIITDGTVDSYFESMGRHVKLSSYTKTALGISYLMRDIESTTSMIAATDVTCITVEKSDFYIYILPYLMLSEEEQFESTIQLLLDCPYFEGLKMNTLAQLAKAFVAVNFQLGDNIFTEKEIFDRFYIITSGYINISTSNEPENINNVLTVGDYLGMLNMDTEVTCKFTATAHGDVSCLCLKLCDFTEIIQTTQRLNHDHSARNTTGRKKSRSSTLLNASQFLGNNPRLDESQMSRGMK